MAVLRAAIFLVGICETYPAPRMPSWRLTTAFSTRYGAESGSWFAVSAVSTDSPRFLSQTFSDIVGQQLTVSGWAIGDPRLKDGLGEITYFFNDQQLGAPTVTGTWTQSDFSRDGHRLRYVLNSVWDNESFIGLDISL